MVKYRQNMNHTTRENLRGGKGTLDFTHIFEGEEVEKTRLFAVITVQPGDSIGVHPHEEEGEAYIILDGAATVSEDGVDHILKAGDAEYCTGGHTHGLVNHTDAPVTLLAVVIN
ncbi:MAG: cupin domain-containing protein [Oscillospiraceae bacterium]|nr:cupin domain-containing protein [Oscillospiraceae bacterium]